MEGRMRESARRGAIITLRSYDMVGRIRSVPLVREVVHRICLKSNSARAIRPSSTRGHGVQVCETHTVVCTQISAQFRKEFLRKLLNYSSDMGHLDLPCLDPGRRGAITLRDGCASVSGIRRDCLRAGLGVTVTQSWYANR